VGLALLGSRKVLFLLFRRRWVVDFELPDSRDAGGWLRLRPDEFWRPWVPLLTTLPGRDSALLASLAGGDDEYDWRLGGCICEYPPLAAASLCGSSARLLAVRDAQELSLVPSYDG